MYLTIDGFEKLTQQEIFDMSVAHIASTRKKSVRLVEADGETGARCVYSGSGCGAAPFLRPECRKEADDIYDSEWASASWSGLRGARLVPEHQMALVAYLQRCHDTSSEDRFVAEWKEKMQVAASEFSLSTEKLDAVPV